MKVCDSARGATAFVMVIMPVKRMPKPTQISPGPLTLLFLINMTRMMPIMSAAGARVEGLKISRTMLPPDSKSMRRMIWAVTVVPMLAPMTMLMACLSVRIPAARRPTVRTMVAEEAWIMAVTSIPVRRPVNVFRVSFCSRTRSVSPELFLRPSPMTSMPKRNMARPPNMVMTPNISTHTPHYNSMSQGNDSTFSPAWGAPDRNYNSFFTFRLHYYLTNGVLRV